MNRSIATGHGRFFQGTYPLILKTESWSKTQDMLGVCGKVYRKDGPWRPREKQRRMEGFVVNMPMRAWRSSTGYLI